MSLTSSPAVILIAHDSACERITGNKRGYELFRAPLGANLSLTASEREQKTHFRILLGLGFKINTQTPIL